MEDEVRKQLMQIEEFCERSPEYRESELKEEYTQVLMDYITPPDFLKNLHIRTKAGILLGKLGDPRVSKVDMVRLKEKTFWMGSQKNDPNGINFDEEMLDGKIGHLSNEGPVHQVTVSEFSISRYPITNSQYEPFFREGGYVNQDILKNCWSVEGRQMITSSYHKTPIFWCDPFYNLPNMPVVGVSWYEAEAFCKWLSLREGKEYRLPTEAEWERAARGDKEGEIYPWGPHWDSARCNHVDTIPAGVKPVGLFPDGAATDGIMDMVGNIMEWVADWFAEYSDVSINDPRGPESGKERVLRGAPCSLEKIYHRSAWRNRDKPTQNYYVNARHGFRIACTSS